MITGTDVQRQMEAEVDSVEPPSAQYARLGVDAQSIAELFKDEPDFPSIIGGICMGLEFARKRAANDPEETKSHDEFLASIAPEGEDFA